MRWKNPRRGPIDPVNFIPDAERCDVINELGAIVLRQACRDGLLWPSVSVSVNISAQQLRDPQFDAFVEASANEVGFPLNRLELEIVESALIEDFRRVAATVDRLRGKEIKIALDDFGTGYSSLTYLRELTFNKLKIDRSFVAEIDSVQSATIIQAVVAMAKALGLKVTAEGVETEGQRTFLRVCGCDYLQGYLFSRPVPADEITRMLLEKQTERRVS